MKIIAYFFFLYIVIIVFSCLGYDYYGRCSIRGMPLATISDIFYCLWVTIFVGAIGHSLRGPRRGKSIREIPSRHVASTASPQEGVDRRLLLRVLVRMLHDCPGRASAAASAIKASDAIVATRTHRPRSRIRRFPRPAPSSTRLHVGDRRAVKRGVGEHPSRVSPIRPRSPARRNYKQTVSSTAHTRSSGPKTGAPDGHGSPNQGVHGGRTSRSWYSPTRDPVR